MTMMIIDEEDESRRNGRLKEAIDEEEEKEVFWRHSTHFVQPDIKYLARIASWI